MTWQMILLMITTKILHNFFFLDEIPLLSLQSKKGSKIKLKQPIKRNFAIFEKNKFSIQMSGKDWTFDGFAWDIKNKFFYL